MATTPIIPSLENHKRSSRILAQSLQRKAFIGGATGSHAGGSNATVGIDYAGRESRAGSVSHAVASAVYSWFWGF